MMLCTRRKSCSGWAALLDCSDAGGALSPFSHFQLCELCHLWSFVDIAKCKSAVPWTNLVIYVWFDIYQYTYEYKKIVLTLENLVGILVRFAILKKITPSYFYYKVDKEG